MVEIDLRSYKSIMSDRVDPDTYLVQVVDIDPGKLDRQNKPQMLVTLRILEGAFEGAELVERLTLDPSSGALFRTVAFLNGLGIPTPRKKIKFDENRVLNRKLFVEVVDNEWNGRTTSQVQAWIKIGGADTSVDVDDLDSLEEPAERPEPARKVAPPEPEPETDDSMEVDLDDVDL